MGEDSVPPRNASPGRRPTSIDVAREAGISQGLVSRAFSGKGSVSKEARERIFEAARRIGWGPNAIAASMVTGNPPLIAVIVARLEFDWRAKVLSRLLAALEEKQIVPLLLYGSDDSRIDDLMVAARNWQTRGVVVAAGDPSPDLAAAILDGGKFVVSINRPVDAKGALSLGTDNRKGGADAGAVLLNDGRDRLVMLAGPKKSWAGSERRAGFIETLKGAQANFDIWHSDDMSVEAGSQAARRWLEMPVGSRANGVFAANDLMAIGFIDGLRSGNAYRPGAISVIGFDNLPAAGWAPYDLTTFAQPIVPIVDALMSHMEVANGEHRGKARKEMIPMRLIAPELVRRATAGKLR